MMRIAIALSLLLVASPLFATNFYFSDCGWNLTDPLVPDAWMHGDFTGKPVDPRCRCTSIVDGKYTCVCIEEVLVGTVGQVPSKPFCLDSESINFRNAFGPVAGDCASPPCAGVAPGDTIYLCAGKCDHVGTATWALQEHTVNPMNPSTVYAQVSGTAGNFITVTPYPGETVILSGDADGDTAYGNGDSDILFTNRIENDTFSGFGFWRFQGPGLVFEKFAKRVADLHDTINSTIEFNDVVIRYIGAGGLGVGRGFYGENGLTPTVHGLYDVSCDANTITNDQETWNIFNWHGNEGSTFRLQNSQVYQSCAVLMRSNGNCFDGSDAASQQLCEAGGGVEFINNVIYGVGGLQNGHQGTGWLWRGNIAYDFLGGINAEENMHNVTIEDNDFSCRGKYKTSSTGKCLTAVTVNDGDLGSASCAATAAADPCSTGCGCSTEGVTIRRNSIWGSSSPSLALFRSGIVFAAHNVTSAAGGAVNALIENNTIYSVLPPNDCRNGSDDPARAMETSLIVASEDAVSVRHNTVYNNKCPVEIRSGFADTYGGTGSPAHLVVGNIFELSSGTTETLQIGSCAAAGSTFEYNSVTESSGVVARVCADDSTNCSGGATFDCALPIASLGATATNFCQTTAYVLTTAPNGTFSLRLRNGATLYAVDRFDDAITLDDIDRQPRPFGPLSDVGADERWTTQLNYSLESE